MYLARNASFYFIYINKNQAKYFFYTVEFVKGLMFNVKVFVLLLLSTRFILRNHKDVNVSVKVSLLILISD